MSLREKSAWISLVATAAVYGAYFVIVGPRLLSGAAGPLSFVGPLVGAIVAFTILQIALIAVAAATNVDDARAPVDERERMIRLLSDRAGFYTLQVGAFAAIVTIFWWRDVAVLANVVFLAMIAAEVTRSAYAILCFRRGIA